MPRPPRFAPAIAAIPGAVFSPTDRPLDGAQLRACPLHVGDTWMEPFAGGRMQDLREADFAGLHRYSVDGARLADEDDDYYGYDEDEEDLGP